MGSGVPAARRRATSIDGLFEPQLHAVLERADLAGERDRSSARSDAPAHARQGIDIGVGYGTPIDAAASGTAASGLDDGDEFRDHRSRRVRMATAYGRPVGIAVAAGSSVAGQAIG